LKTTSIVGRESPSESLAVNRMRRAGLSNSKRASLMRLHCCSLEVGGTGCFQGRWCLRHCRKRQHGFTVRSLVSGRWPSPKDHPVRKDLGRRRFHAFCPWLISKPVCFRLEPVARHSSSSRLRQRPRLLSSDSRGFASPPCVATEHSAKLLSWGFPKIASPPVSAPHVRTVLSDSHGWLPTPGAKMPLSARAPSLPFHPASTVSSVRPLAGLLHPATGPEVRPVSDRF